MKAIVMDSPRKSVVVEVETPKISDDQLLVNVKYTGVCHSEWHPWSTAKKGERFGHEPVGVVADVGRNVKGFKIGDRVTGLGCGYSEYIVMDPKTTVHIPDTIADEDAIAEPLACLLSAAGKIPLPLPGEPVAVVGTGYMGLGMISLLKLKGAGRIIAVDTREEARANAVKFGATEVYAPEQLPKDYALDWKMWGSDELTELTDSQNKKNIFNTGFKTVVEFAGTQTALRLAGDMVCAHGLLGIGGYHNDTERCIDFKLWNVKAFTAINCHERRLDYLTDCCRQAMTLLSSGQWSFKGLSNHIYSMSEFDQANHDLESKPQGFIKAIVRCCP